jgi:hypothetical protein
MNNQLSTHLLAYFDIAGGIWFPPMDDFFKIFRLITTVVCAVIGRMAVRTLGSRLNRPFFPYAFDML